MCGRYIPNTEEEIMEIREILRQISVRLSQTGMQNLYTQGDVYPTHEVPMITPDGVFKTKWGFEKWDGKGVVINAKSENIFSSKFFMPYAQSCHCIIPAHGYYEWKDLPDKRKIKYAFTDNRPSGIFMAGLYRPNKGIQEFVILTKKADKNIETIHPRMPLMIKPEQMAGWLNGSLDINVLMEESSDMVFKEAG